MIAIDKLSGHYFGQYATLLILFSDCFAKIEKLKFNFFWFLSFYFLDHKLKMNRKQKKNLKKKQIEMAECVPPQLIQIIRLARIGLGLK